MLVSPTGPAITEKELSMTATRSIARGRRGLKSHQFLNNRQETLSGPAVTTVKAKKPFTGPNCARILNGVNEPRLFMFLSEGTLRGGVLGGRSA